MRIQTTTTALACLLALSNLQVLGSDPIDRAWQTAIDPVTLHLRNKLADLPYTVTFIVTAIGQDTEWSYTTESEPNAWQRPQFPRDFTGPIVDHLQAGTGAFVEPDVGHGSTLSRSEDARETAPGRGDDVSERSPHPSRCSPEAGRGARVESATR